MPANLRIMVKCHIVDCYWNIDRGGEDFPDNCAAREIVLSDSTCSRYINYQEAETRLAKAAKKVSRE